MFWTSALFGASIQLTKRNLWKVKIVVGKNIVQLPLFPEVSNREKPKGSVRDSCTSIDQQQAGFSFFELPWSCSE
jgi:hypothetical protein